MAWGLWKAALGGTQLSQMQDHLLCVELPFMSVITLAPRGRAGGENTGPAGAAGNAGRPSAPRQAQLPDSRACIPDSVCGRGFQQLLGLSPFPSLPKIEISEDKLWS
ncbi:hypothetical protein VULLAG_LOCUS3367 [Vulpes lagopus]